MMWNFDCLIIFTKKQVFQSSTCNIEAVNCIQSNSTNLRYYIDYIKNGGRIMEWSYFELPNLIL